jgi:hypothetical protein
MQHCTWNWFGIFGQSLHLLILTIMIWSRIWQYHLWSMVLNGMYLLQVGLNLAPVTLFCQKLLSIFLFNVKVNIEFLLLLRTTEIVLYKSYFVAICWRWRWRQPRGDKLPLWPGIEPRSLDLQLASLPMDRS